jgi:hypothetical protein
LSDGQNFLASVITPSVTSAISTEINSTISDALGSAGPFGPVLSSVATGLADVAFDGILGALGFGGGGGFGGGLDAGPSQRYPGASESDPPANYGGVAWSTGSGGPDVVFSLRPANSGPQLSGQNALADPSAVTSMSYLNYTGDVPDYAGYNWNADNFFKAESMGTLSLTGDTSTYWSDPNMTSMFENPEFGVAGSGFGQPEGWTFICAPEDINWDLANASNRIDIFGTNNPPMVAGTKGMRDLSIGNALVEGFSRGVQVEDKIRALEALMNYGANTSDGFVSVPVYQFYANDKSYGSTATEQGYFIIGDISVKEEMRDFSGNTTRAYVDIKLKQVPAYQVNTGRDQASKVTTGAKSGLLDQQQVNSQQNAAAANSKPTAQQGGTVNGGQTQQGATPGNRSSASVPTNAAPAAGQTPARRQVGSSLGAVPLQGLN